EARGVQAEGGVLRAASLTHDAVGGVVGTERRGIARNLGVTGRRLHDDHAIACRRLAVEVELTVAILADVAAAVGGPEGGESEHHQNGDSSRFRSHGRSPGWWVRPEHRRSRPATLKT